MGLWYQGCRVQGPSVAPFLLRWPLTIPWSLADFDAHEDVHFFHDRSTGLRAIIAIHSTHLGPAAGGARYWPYAGDDEPLIDALRLSRGMSYKNAIAGQPMGGGKAVILRDDAIGGGHV